MAPNSDDVLILFFNSPKNKNIILDSINMTEGFSAQCVFFDVPKILRMVRRLHIKSGLPGISIWFMSWKKKIAQYKKVICIASSYSNNILKWIKLKVPSSQLINYYWDRIDISNYPVIKCKEYVNWTFCKYDSEKYGMPYNPQFYVETMELPKSDLLYEVSFVGADRQGKWTERCKYVVKAYDMLKKHDLNLYFHLVTQSNNVPVEIKKDAFLTEHEYNGVVASSKAVLEIVQPGKEWITLRPLLALTNGKKVITNNRYISEELFYSKDNVFILGVDDESKISDFVNSSYVHIDRSRISYYELKQWGKRFFNEEKYVI